VRLKADLLCRQEGGRLLLSVHGSHFADISVGEKDKSPPITGGRG